MGVTEGTGGGASLATGWAEACEVDEARVEVEEEREKVKLRLVETERSESLDIWEMERWRARASYEFFLVCDGDRFGIAGAPSG